MEPDRLWGPHSLLLGIWCVDMRDSQIVSGINVVSWFLWQNKEYDFPCVAHALLGYVIKNC